MSNLYETLTKVTFPNDPQLAQGLAVAGQQLYNQSELKKQIDAKQQEIQKQVQQKVQQTIPKDLLGLLGTLATIYKIGQQQSITLPAADGQLSIGRLGNDGVQAGFALKF